MFGALLGAVAAPIIGGLFNRKTSKDNAAAAAGLNKSDKEYNNRIRKEDRKYFLADTASERAYAERLLAADRANAAALLADDRAYSEKRLRQDRSYDRKVKIQDRQNERAYLAQRLADDRAYAERQVRLDRSEYKRDRNYMQARSNRLAERSAASRGIDFKRLVSDATEAGFNPMTALGMAGAYSTNVDYQPQGGVYSNRANFQPNGAGYNAAAAGGGGSGGGGVPMSTPLASSPVSPGGFVSPGSGFQSQFAPAMSSGNFVAEAVQRGVDTWFNRPPEKDALAEALRSAMQAKTLAEAGTEAAIPQSFGYDLTAVRPFRPAGAVSKPVLGANANVPMRGTSQSDDMVTPSSLPLKVAGRDFEPSGQWSDASAAEERYGDVMGSVYGGASFVNDVASNLVKAGSSRRAAYERAKGRKVIEIDGEYYMEDIPADYSGPEFPRGMADWFASGSNMNRPAFDLSYW